MIKKEDYMIDAENSTDGYNEDWKVALRQKLSSSIFGQCSEELYTEIGYCYQCYAPAFLYKYYSNNNSYHFDAVKNNTMWYSSATNFNDAFDCDLFVDETSIFQSIIAASPSAKGLKKGSPMWMEFKRKSAQATQKLQQVFEEMKRETGISCFSELDDSLLMWAHYANNHRGFCVEYELLEICKQLKFTPIPVIYSNEKNIVRSLFPQQLEESVTRLVVDSLTTKSTDWSYEKEWRIVRDNNACGDAWDEENHGAVLPMIKPTSIILGCEVTDSFQQKMQEHCKENKINLYKMKKDNYYYKLNKTTILSFDVE